MFGTIKNLNIASAKISGISTDAESKYKLITKVTGATVGSAGLAKGAVDLGEAIMCQDGVCATVSFVGCCADAIQIIASFVPGPNITQVITTPVSVGCKVFVWCCKKSKLPWGGC